MNPQGRKIWYPANYWREGQEQPKMIAYTIVVSPYVKITPRIEPRPPNPSCDIDTTMIKDSAISTTYNLRLCSIQVIQCLPLTYPHGYPLETMRHLFITNQPPLSVPNSIGSQLVRIFITTTCYQ